MDLYVRSLNDLCNLDYHVYCSQENGMIFEMIYSRHVIDCEIAFSDT